jgi:hypothetical protein
MLTVALLASCGRDDRTKSAEARPRLHACEYGMTIFFGLGGDSERIRIRGWSHTEPHFTWTDGDNAALGVRLPPSKHPIQLRFKMAGMTAPPRVQFQRVDVHVNSEKLASWQVSHEDVFTVVVPAKFVRPPKRAPGAPKPFVLEPGTRLLIEFSIPDAISPLDAGQSGDPRRLGLRLAELHIANDPPTPPAQRP